MKRPSKLLAGMLVAGWLVSASASTSLEQGNRAWASRAEGFAATGSVKHGPAAEAVAALAQAASERPDDIPLRLALIEALYFQGHFAVDEGKERKKIFERAVDLAEETVDLAAAAVGDPEKLRHLPPEERAARLKQAPHAAAAHFWAAITWGLWGMSHSRALAGMKNVAGKIRDHARIVTMLDPAYADGGGLRLLGRLHTATPRVPLFTGWIDRREGLDLLRQANAVSTKDPRNPLFLAEALLRYEPEHRDAALALLREVVSRKPDPAYLVEQTEILDQARGLLAEWASTPGGALDDPN